MPRPRPVVNIDAAVRLYYERIELSTADIKEIWGISSSKTAGKYRDKVREEMVKRGKEPYDVNCVNTDIAFEVWGLSIKDLEYRRARLQKLFGQEAANV